MYFVKINSKNKFCFSKEIELMFAANGILSEDSNNSYYIKTYGEEFLSYIKKKYFFLYQLHKQQEYFCNGFFELLIDMELENLNLKAYEDKLLSMKKEDILYKFFAGEGNYEEYMKSVKNNDVMGMYEALNSPHNHISYLVFELFFTDFKRIISDFLSCVRELETKEFHQILEETINESLECEKIKKGLLQKEPLEYSEHLMGKTFRRRGPYEIYYFMPSVYLPFQCIRFMGKTQILAYSIVKKKMEVKDIAKILKVIGDETRLSILHILSEEGPLIGKEIANKLTIATSTLSHHMEQLGSIAVIHEEKIKNSKYYSINQNIMEELLEKLANELGAK